MKNKTLSASEILEILENGRKQIKQITEKYFRENK